MNYSQPMNYAMLSETSRTRGYSMQLRDQSAVSNGECQSEVEDAVADWNRATPSRFPPPHFSLSSMYRHSPGTSMMAHDPCGLSTSSYAQPMRSYVNQYLGSHTSILRGNGSVSYQDEHAYYTNGENASLRADSSTDNDTTMCKGFFRRSIQKRMNYRCLRDNKCPVLRTNRNRCQSCRFKKCLGAGMSRDSVRYGRMGKRKKHEDLDEVIKSDVKRLINRRQLTPEENLIATLYTAHKKHSSYLSGNVKKIRLSACQLLFAAGNVYERLKPEEKRFRMWQALSSRILPEIRHVVFFAKEIPEFETLDERDKLLLIRTVFLETWIMRAFFTFDLRNSTIVFDDGSIVHKNDMITIYGEELIELMFNFVNSLSPCKLSDEEIGVFTAIVIVSRDLPDLHEVNRVRAIRAKLVDAFRVLLERRHCSNDHLFEFMMSKRTDLQVIGEKHWHLLKWFRYATDNLH